MVETIKLAGVFAMILVLLRIRWNMGAVMLISAAVLGVLMRLAPLEIARIFYRSAIEKTTLTIIAALALIMVMENILRKTGTLKSMVDSLHGLVGDNRVVMALMPAIIGILPSAGGAYFSAPMVEESSSGCELEPHRKSFINYWFRHIWEYVSPLYPGFILAVAVTGLSFGSLFRSQVVLFATTLAVGAVFGFIGIKKAPPRAARSRWRDAGVFAWSFAPILAVMVMVMAFAVNLLVALVAVLVFLVLFHRYGVRRIGRALREGIAWRPLFLVLGIMIFKGMIEGSGVVAGLPALLESAGVPVVVVLFLFPLVAGFVTSLPQAVVGITYPVVVPLATSGGEINLGVLAFAFACGFAGVMFSPIHLCLVLTKEYFKSSLFPIYRMMLAPQAVVVAVAFVQLVLYGGLALVL